MSPKYFFSIYQQKFCLLRKERDQYLFEQMGENVKPLDIPEGAEIVTGLASADVILRPLILKLKSKREILAALPFQVENLLPYSAEELLLLPALDKQKEQTEISLLATSKSTLAHHLDGEIDPDIVSCVPLALYRYFCHFFPDQQSRFLQYENTFLVIENRKFVAFQMMRQGDEKRILALMQKKYPDIPETPIQRGEHWDCAIPIGLALDAAIGDQRSAQFRQNNNLSKSHQNKRKKGFLRFFSACSCFILLTLVLGNLHLKKKEHAILSALGCSQKMPLHEAVFELEESLYKQKKSTVPLSTLPKVSQLLAWLSTHPMLREDCSITRLRYQLVKSPRLGTQIKTYSAKVELELTSQNPRAARSFHDVLLRDNEIVDQKNDVRWSADHGIYRATFHVKPQKM